MIGKDYTNNLKEILDQLQEAAKHLNISLQRSKTAKSGIGESENTLIEFEALTTRFAKVADMLIHKVYRSIDYVEFAEGGSIIDVMNRADKQNFIDSAQEMRILKDLRNDIAHEYITERIQLLHFEVLERTPKLLQLVNRALHYCKKYLK
ncbi:MAG: hypothetical protein H0W50_04525 [Parachlamydiaceae bacterium]|nr:hypothetical protein [Parachlamydiaceae bacterium]